MCGRSVCLWSTSQEHHTLFLSFRGFSQWIYSCFSALCLCSISETWLACYFDSRLLLAEVSLSKPPNPDCSWRAGCHLVNVCMNGWMWGNIVQRFERSLDRNALHKCGPFTLKTFWNEWRIKTSFSTECLYSMGVLFVSARVLVSVPATLPGSLTQTPRSRQVS